MPATRLVLLPGLICDASIWAPQIVALADFQPIAFDGYGLADSLPAMARVVLDVLPRGTIALAGHSMGARVALELIRMAPERVERLALLDTGIHAVRAGEAEARYRLRDLGRREGMARLVDAWLPQMVGAARREDMTFLAPIRTMCERAGLASFEAQIKALLARPALDSLLPAIGCPTLVGVGRLDEWSPPAQHEAIAAAIPRAELVIFEDAGHLAPLEAPTAVNEALRRWMNSPG